MALDQDLRIAIDGKWRHVRVAARTQLADLNLAFNHELSMEEARERTFEQLRLLIPTGIPAAGFRSANGGGGDPGAGAGRGGRAPPAGVGTRGQG